MKPKMPVNNDAQGSEFERQFIEPVKSRPASDFDCEIDEHDPRADRTAALCLPDGKGGHFFICETCAKDIFESYVRPVQH